MNTFFRRIFLVFTTFLLLSSSLFSQEKTTTYKDLDTVEARKNGAQFYHISPKYDLMYYRPKPFSAFLSTPKDMYEHVQTPVKYWQVGGMFLGTAALCLADQYLIERAQQFGRWAGLDPTAHEVNLSPIAMAPLYMPKNANTAMYFIGDGWTHMSIDASFYIYGLINSDNRALQTSRELTEGLMAIGTYVQILKHLTGRESPNHATVRNGKWQWFPTWKEFYSCVPQHDAFPSGHMATAMMTVTVIAENYPDYAFIRPLGYSMMGLLGYAMMNNQVHWISDYPLSIAMGYSFGKMVCSKYRTKIIKFDKSSSYKESRLDWSPTILGSGFGMHFSYSLN